MVGPSPPSNHDRHRRCHHPIPAPHRRAAAVRIVGLPVGAVRGRGRCAAPQALHPQQLLELLVERGRACVPFCACVRVRRAGGRTLWDAGRTEDSRHAHHGGLLAVLRKRAARPVGTQCRGHAQGPPAAWLPIAGVAWPPTWPGQEGLRTPRGGWAAGVRNRLGSLTALLGRWLGTQKRRAASQDTTQPRALRARQWPGGSGVSARPCPQQHPPPPTAAATPRAAAADLEGRWRLRPWMRCGRGARSRRRGTGRWWWRSGPQPAAAPVSWLPCRAEGPRAGARVCVWCAGAHMPLGRALVMKHAVCAVRVAVCVWDCVRVHVRVSGCGIDIVM